MRPVLQLLLLFSSILSATSVSFRCTTRTTCQGMIGYVSPNTTTLSSIIDLFGLQSVYSLLAANSWPTSDSNRSITAGSTVRIPFPCTCTDGKGISDRTPYYTVKKGDEGLDYIARTIFIQFVTYQEIVAVNNIPDPNVIQIGQRLRIPLPCSCDDVDTARVVHYGHVVAKGSSVSQIAGEFETTQATLMNLNNQTLSDPKNLQAGQILDVPIKACTSNSTPQVVVPKGSYSLTANNCVKCSCNLTDSKTRWLQQFGYIQCVLAEGVPVSNWTKCPPAQCGTLSLGQSQTLNCESCVYDGFDESNILTKPVYQSPCSTPNSTASIGGNGRTWSGVFLSSFFGLLCVVFP